MSAVERRGGGHANVTSCLRSSIEDLLERCMSELTGSYAGTRQLAALVKARYDEFVLAFMEAGRRASPDYIASLGDEELLRRAKLTLNAYTSALADDPPTAYADFFEKLSFIRFSSGV